MRIKSSQSHRRHLNSLSAYLRTRSRRFWLLVAWTGLVFVGGAAAAHLGLHRPVLRLFSSQTMAIAKNRINGWLATPDRITVDIAHTDFLKLMHQKERAAARGVLISSEDDYVPARIRYRDQNIRAKLRLKGDLTDHLLEDKWSFRVIVRRDDTLFGMKRFSLQHPGTRAYLYEYIYHRAMEREDVLALRYSFVEVTINGRPNGIYALEEHFGTRLVEHRRRRAGPIVRFDEDVFWAELARQEHTPQWHRRGLTGASSFHSAAVDGFQTERWLSEEATLDEYLAAVHMLERFQRGLQPASEVFDVDRMARYLALTDLLAAWHGSEWTNMRFYYNPVTSRLEPVAFDAYDRHVPRAWYICGTAPLRRPSESGDEAQPLSLLFADRELYERYVAELERVSEPVYLETLIEDLQPEIEENLSILHRDYPGLQFSWAPLRQNREIVAAAVAPPKALHAFLQERAEEGLVLDLGNTQELPVELVGATYGDSAPLLPEGRVLLPGKHPQAPIQYRTVRLRAPPDARLPAASAGPVTVEYRMVGSARVQTTPAFPWPHERERGVEVELLRQPPNIREFEFVAVNEDDRRIALRPGAWRVDRDMVVPPGYRLVAGPGTVLALTAGAAIISYSPLQFVGDPDAPVRITSEDSLGQGLAVLQAGGTSNLEHVIFENLDSPRSVRWALTGAVTFYESPLRCSGCQFVNARAEDALNIIRTEFSINQSQFASVASDALDVDFGTGDIRRSRFSSSGNDAIDVSGSSVELEDVVISGTGDKGLSVGENSNLRGRNVTIRDAYIAVASKDLSRLLLHDVRVANARFGVTAYQKKSEFGSGEVQIENLEMQGTSRPYLVERHSRVTVNDTAIPDESRNVIEELYPPASGSRR